jgi:hypothetical protein
MIKTLRITSIVAAALGGLLLVFPVVCGVRGDSQIEQLLSSPSVVEKFKEAAGNRVKTSDGEASPLAKQAEALASYLNPPAPKPTAQPTQAPKIPTPLTPPSAKFTLVATSVYEGHPDMSLAFIDEPGKGQSWIGQSAAVGHLTIKEIKDGAVVVDDGQKTYEIVVAQSTPQASILEGSAPSSVAVQTPPPTLENPAPSAVAIEPPPPPPMEVSAEGEAQLDKLMSQLANLQKSSNSDKTGEGVNEEDSAAMMEKLLTDFHATRVSPEEAKKLDGLGKELESIQGEPNQPLPPAVPTNPAAGIKPELRTRKPTRLPPNLSRPRNIGSRPTPPNPSKPANP